MDAMRVGRHDLAFAVVAGGLRHVDAIAHAVDDVEVVARESVVEQVLFRCALGVDAVKGRGRHFQPLAHLRAADAHDVHVVGVDIEVGDVANRHRPGRDVGVVLRPATPAGLEGRGRRQQRQVGMGRACQRALGVGQLRQRDDLHRRVVGHLREVALDRRHGARHLGTHVGQRAFVFGADQLRHGRVSRHGLFRGAVDHRAQLSPGVAGLPALRRLVQHQVDDTQVAAPEAGHHRGHAVDGAARQVHLGVAVEEAAREFTMRMAEDDGVDARHLGQPGHGVLGEEHGLAKLEAGVRQQHHHVRALGAHLGHQRARGLGDVARDHAAQQVAAVPQHDLRRHEADDGDLQLLRAAGFVDEAAVQDHVRRKGLGVLGHALGRAFVVEHVGVDIRKGRAGQRAAQERQAVVELVIADIGRVVAQCVHDLVGRVRLACRQRLDARDEVTQRVALKQIAVVEEQCVLHLGACGLHQRGRARQAVFIHRLVLVVVVGHQAHVHVGRAQDAQLELLRMRRRPQQGQADQQQQGFHAWLCEAAPNQARRNSAGMASVGAVRCARSMTCQK